MGQDGRENGAIHGNGPDEQPMLPARMEELEETLARAREELEHYVERAAGFIRERPVASVAGAVALGWLIGRIASRR